MTDDMKWAFVGDLQIPYHDPRAVELFFKAMKAWKPDSIDIVGDIDDQLEYSSFSDGTTDEFFNTIKAEQKVADKAYSDHQKEVEKRSKELPEGFTVDLEPPRFEPINPLPFIKANADGAKEFYKNVRKQHPKADIHASLGNHEMRVFKYIDKKAPEIIGEITPEFLWGLDNQGITWKMYEEPPFKRFADIYVHHGKTTAPSGCSVRADIDAYNINLVRGHDHRGGVVYKSYPMSGQTLMGMSTGHLCDPAGYGLRYTINPAWEQGFGIAHVVDDKAHLQFIPIIDYTCVIDGKVFRN